MIHESSFNTPDNKYKYFVKSSLHFQPTQMLEVSPLYQVKIYHPWTVILFPFLPPHVCWLSQTYTLFSPNCLWFRCPTLPSPSLPFRFSSAFLASKYRTGPAGGKLQPTGHTKGITNLLKMAHKLRMLSTHVSHVKLWNLRVKSINRFYWNTAMLICLHIIYDAFMLQEQRWVVATKSTWSTSL